MFSGPNAAVYPEIRFPDQGGVGICIREFRGQGRPGSEGGGEGLEGGGSALEEAEAAADGTRACLDAGI